MKYAISRFKKEQEDMAYAIYVTDTLYYNSHNKCLNNRFFDLIDDKPVKEEKAEDIVANVMAGAGLRWTE